ncbi:MAG: PSD1 and planctomycete cytochrome C domain-containing protein [Planctomycetota bacterium]|nr:PSD1 and planctomycete cytochrome C domain-containing protein [Planctomycetota bacterium]
MIVLATMIFLAKRKTFTVIAFWLATAIACSAEDPTIGSFREVMPILRERCCSCHGVLKQESGLRLDTGLLAKKGGNSGAAIVPGDSKASPLIARLLATDDSLRMPPEGKPLTVGQIGILARWIEAGAISPENEQPEQDPRQHWAFQKPDRPQISVFDSSGTIQFTNPIDAFISRQRSAKHTAAMPPTDRASLLRRLYLDLVGLPPSADELVAFLTNKSENAYEEVVDRLLASPQHGERWGRHWMDVWRYSDWYGRRSVPDVMNSYPMIWRWRDWIVRSINEDKPYDRMVVEMLAADELLPTVDQNILATGYLVRSWFKWNYETWKKDLVEHTGKAFLGLTLNCCQCHDHKYDPFTQEEYFRFRAFFEPLELRHDRVPGEADPGQFEKYVYTKSYGPIKSGMIRVIDEFLNAETFMFAKGDSRLRMEGKPPVTSAAPAVIGGDQIQVARIALPIEAAYPGMKKFIQDEERRKRHDELTHAESELALARSSFSAEPPALREKLHAAEIALALAREDALSHLTNSPGIKANLMLEGAQSLTLDATTGRRALSHLLPGLDLFSDHGTVSYLVQIVKDGNTNLQLGLDIAKGATGGFVAFDHGNIKTYKPGGFNEFAAGSYDVSKGQDRFQVSMQLNLNQNEFLLSVTSLNDGAVVVDRIPGALNGWKPQTNGKRGLFIDCRSGTQVNYDGLTFTQPDGTKLLTFDFEPPTYVDGQDVVDVPATVGSVSWMLTGFCLAPATSKISSAVSSNPAVQTALTRLAEVQNAVRLPSLKIAAAEARWTAAKLETKSLDLRIEADAVRYSSGLLSEDRQAEPDVRALIHAACQLERDAALAKAKADRTAADEAIASAEIDCVEAGKLPDKSTYDTANKALQAAQKKRAVATSALDIANSNLLKEPCEYTPLSPKYPQVSSGRRAALAEWIASRENPLTARVAVNHIWLRHFGKAIVETTNDFGRNGSQPTHPELLDWLACELMDSGWSMKHIHRLIVTSQSYRMTSMLPRSSGELPNEFLLADAEDPDNTTYWRFPATRMQAEVVRDSLLQVSGELDATLAGHDIDHKLGMTSYRRSLYFTHHGEEKMEFLELFDAANACDCYKRSSSVQPQQALALTNSELTKTLSRQLAKRLWSQSLNASDPAIHFVKLSFLQVLNREPRDLESEASLRFLEQQAERLMPSDRTAAKVWADRARENLVHALMNHNDFVTVR